MPTPIHDKRAKRTAARHIVGGEIALDHAMFVSGEPAPLAVRPCQELVGPVHIVVILHGLPGAGKSTVAGLLGGSGLFEVVSFDQVWAAMQLHPESAAPDQQTAVYMAGIKAAARAARSSHVVLDCTSRTFAFRSVATRLLRAYGCQVVFVLCELPPVTARERVIRRHLLSPGHLGRGSWHFDAIAATFDALSTSECGAVPRVVVDTSGRRPSIKEFWGVIPLSKVDRDACELVTRLISRAPYSSFEAPSDWRSVMVDELIRVTALLLDSYLKWARRGRRARLPMKTDGVHNQTRKVGESEEP